MPRSADRGGRVHEDRDGRRRSTPASARCRQRAGVRERMAQVGPRMIRDFMPDQHRELFAKLPLLLVGSLDARGPAVGLGAGGPPRLRRTRPTRARCASPRWPLPGDPLADERSRAGAPLGLLGIELADAPAQPHERHGRSRVDARGFAVAVDQSFGNCPQYIQAREPRCVGDRGQRASPRPARGSAAADRRRRRRSSRRADTFFIASAARGRRSGDAAHGVDVSHRGGKPGFVRVERATAAARADGARLPRQLLLQHARQPRASHPRAGLLFVDFDTRRRCCQLTGAAEIVWDGPELAAFAGAERLLRFRVDEGVLVEHARCRCAGPRPSSRRSWRGRGPGAGFKPAQPGAICSARMGRMGPWTF